MHSPNSTRVAGSQAARSTCDPSRSAAPRGFYLAVVIGRRSACSARRRSYAAFRQAPIRENPGQLLQKRISRQQMPGASPTRPISRCAGGRSSVSSVRTACRKTATGSTALCDLMVANHTSSSALARRVATKRPRVIPKCVLFLRDRRRGSAGSPARNGRRYTFVRQGIGADHHPAGFRQWGSAADHRALLHPVRALDSGQRNLTRHRGPARSD